MKSLYVNGFAAIDKLQLNIDKKMQVIIGEQATGKSTVAKLIYFSLKVRDYLLDYLTIPGKYKLENKNESYIYFLKYVRKQFMGCFGTTKHMSSFRIRFNYEVEKKEDDTKELILSLKNGYVKIEFSKSMERQVRGLLNESIALFNKQNESHPLDVFSNVISDLQIMHSLRNRFKQGVDELFNEDEEIIYIPAGRSILASMSEQLTSIDTSDTALMDLPLREFVALIQRMKVQFGTRIPDVVKDYTKIVSGQIKNRDVDYAYELIKKILKADYVNEFDGEKLYYDEKRWVKLMYASSGQQESLWILLLIFLKILKNQKSFIVLEEPEAHLYPSAQRHIMELIALLIFSNNSSVLVTTHSPYILTVINLLAYSGKVENSIKVNQKVVVPKQYRLKPNELIAYKLSQENGFLLKNIMDTEEKLIDVFEIDEISREINEATEEIMDIEVEHGL